MIDEINIVTTLGLQDTGANTNNLVGGQLAFLIVAARKSVQRRQETNSLQTLDKSKRMQNVEDLVHFRRCERLHAHVLQEWKRHKRSSNSSNISSRCARRFVVVVVFVDAFLIFSQDHARHEILTNELERYLTIGYRQTIEHGTAGNDAEQAGVRLAEIVHAQVELSTRFDALEHARRVEKSDVGRVETAVLQIKVLEWLHESVQEAK